MAYANDILVFDSLGYWLDTLPEAKGVFSLAYGYILGIFCAHPHAQGRVLSVCKTAIGRRQEILV